MLLLPAAFSLRLGIHTLASDQLRKAAIDGNEICGKGRRYHRRAPQGWVSPLQSAS